MTLENREQHVTSVRSVLSAVVYPVQLIVDLPIRAGLWVSENFVTRRELAAKNAGLRQQQLLIRSRLEKYAQLEAENRRLRELLDSSVKVGERVMIAELLSVDMDPFSRRIVLNRGTREGVVAGQSLIDANGIMGQVVHAGPLSSTALLITDPSHALPVQIVRTGFRTVAIGAGVVNELKLSDVPNNADIQVGDFVVTSGLGGRFPAGYPVGRIVTMERDSRRPFARIMVKPSAKLERNREVLLILPEEEPRPVAPGDASSSPDGL